MPVVPANDIELHFEEQGSGAPLLLGHSLTLTGGMYREAAARLSENYLTYALDFRGHGGSSAPDTSYTLDDVAEDCIDFIRRQELPPVGWIGLSMGGMTGMRVALREPELLGAMVLLDTSAQQDPKRDEYVAFAERNRHKDPDATYAANISTMMLSKHTQEQLPQLRPQVEELVTANSATGLYRSTLAVLQREDIRGQLGNISIPTLVIVGEEDRITPPAMARDIHEAIPKSELFVVPDAGHLSIMEQPDRVLPRIEEFFAEHLS